MKLNPGIGPDAVSRQYNECVARIWRDPKATVDHETWLEVVATHPEPLAVRTHARFYPKRLV